MPTFTFRPLLAGLLLLGALLSPGLVAAQDEEPEYVPDELLVGFQAGVTEAQAEATYRAHGGAKLEKLRQVNVHRIRVAPAALEAVAQALSRRPGVEFVEPNWRLAPDGTANDPYFKNAWHLPKIGATAAWDVVQQTAIVVAVLDSGVDGTHPDLATKMVPGFNFYNNNTNTADATGHGTAVAGTVGAITNNGIGVASVAPRTRLMPIRTTDPTGYSYASAVVNGMTWAVDHGAKVLNLSIGGVAGVSSIKTAAQYVRSKGGVVVAAAGNCGCVDSTTENPYIISVSATIEDDRIASFSSRGNYIDVAAPGNHIYTTNRGGSYGMWGGTSFASPVAAGVVALMMGANPDLSPAEIEKLLKANADDLGAAGWDSTYGHGRVNADRAVLAAIGSLATAPAPDTTKPTVSIASPASGATVSGLTNVSVTASDNTAVSRVDLYVDGKLYASDPSAPFTAVWDTKKMANGSHTLVARAYDLAGNEGVSGSVGVKVNNPIADTSPPATQITAIWAHSPNFSATVAASDNVGVVKVELYIDGKLWGTSASAPKTFTYPLTSLSPGTRMFQSKAYDAAGNVGTSSPTYFTHTVSDTTVPVTQITAIWAHSPNFSATVAASDNVGVVKVELYIDGKLWGTSPSAPKTFTYALTSLSPGKHLFQSKAYDAAGNVGTSPATYFTKADTTAPATQITAIWAHSPSFSATVAASDNVGVVKVELYIDGKLWGTSASAPKTFTYALTSLSPGQHLFQSKAYDAAGNVGTSPATYVTLADTTAPLALITAIWAHSPYFSATVMTADNVGVVKIELYIDGKLWGTSASAQNTFTYALSSLSSGKHLFQAKVYDAAGNVGTSPAAYFTK